MFSKTQQRPKNNSDFDDKEYFNRATVLPNADLEMSEQFVLLFFTPGVCQIQWQRNAFFEKKIISKAWGKIISLYMLTISMHVQNLFFYGLQQI
jgi:hypothetical protein